MSSETEVLETQNKRISGDITMVNKQSITNIDEVIDFCIDEQARQHIAEAITCYKAKAFRSCVIATWLAIVFNYIHKLQELKLAGDKEAKVILDELETIRVNNDVSGSGDFEKKLLDVAKDKFELISIDEYKDLKNLYNTRNRCAHPSINIDEEIYQPTPELALHYVRIAVTYLLQYPPVQGKAALDRLMEDVKSIYFPATIKKAVIRFKNSPLSRARDALIRNFVIRLLKTLVNDEHDNNSENRHIVAFNAVWQMYSLITEQTLTEKLSKLMSSLNDEKLEIAIKRLRGIPNYRKFLEAGIGDKVKMCINNIWSKDPTLGLLIFLEEEDSRVKALESLKNIDVQKLLLLVHFKRHPDFVPRAVELYVESESYDSANTRGTELIIPLAKYLTIKEIEIIIEGISKNTELEGSFKVKNVLTSIQSTSKISKEEFDNLIKKYNLQDKWFFRS